MSTTLPAVKYLTKCRVPGCEQTFSKSALDIPIVGEPNRPLKDFVTALLKHVQNKHLEKSNELAALIEMWIGLITLNLFQLQDPKLIQEFERTRALIHRLTRRNYIADEYIEEKLAELGYEKGAEESEALKALLVDMRNVLTEEGRYAPQIPDTTPLVRV